MSIRILTDSTSYINEEIRKELDIRVVPLGLSFGNESFKETEIDNETFYEMMSQKGIPTSSQPSVGNLENEMRSMVEKGIHLCCIFLSSEMSGTFATAQLVKKMLLEKYENAKIAIIDSRSNCMQLGFSVIQAARAAKEGMNLEQVMNSALQNIKRSRFLFIPANLNYLKKGGRIGGAGALLGNLFKIIPILTVEDGKTSVLMKVRTKGLALRTMVDEAVKDITQHGLGEIVVHHINCKHEAKELAEAIKEKLKVNIDIMDIGPVIGLHVGPGALGIAYYTQQDMR